MKPIHLKALLALLLMLAAFAGAQAWRPTARLADTRPKIDLETMFPKSFGDWVIDEHMPVQLVSPDTAALLSKIYNQTLSRTYVNAQRDRVMLSVAYGGDQSDGTRAHRPDVCYPAQGFEILSRGKATLALQGRKLPVLQMLAKMGPRIEPVTYWFIVGEKVALSGTEQKLAQLAYSTRGVIPDGMLIRASTIDSDVGRAYETQSAFVQALYASVPIAWRAQIFGESVSQLLTGAVGADNGRR